MHDISVGRAFSAFAIHLETLKVTTVLPVYLNWVTVS